MTVILYRKVLICSLTCASYMTHSEAENISIDPESSNNTHNLLQVKLYQ